MAVVVAVLSRCLYLRNKLRMWSLALWSMGRSIGRGRPKLNRHDDNIMAEDRAGWVGGKGELLERVRYILSA